MNYNHESLLSKAFIFAVKAHDGIYRKCSKIPYITHPVEACEIVSRIKPDEILMSAAILHDTIEDCENINYDTIKENFNERIAYLVQCQTEDKTKNWEYRKKHTIDFLKNTNDIDIKILALADKLSNMRSIYKDYVVMKDNIWQKFNQKNKDKQLWYYKNILYALSDLKDTPQWKEFDKLLHFI